MAASNKHTYTKASPSSTSTSCEGSEQHYVDNTEPLGNLTKRTLEELLFERNSLERYLKELNKIIAKRLIDLEL